MAKSMSGPFRSQTVTADTSISPKPVWFGTYTVTNKSAAAVTISFYDSADLTFTTPIEEVIIGANTTQAIYPNGETLNGLLVKASAWASVAVYLRWAPR